MASPTPAASSSSGDVPTVLVRDSHGRQLLCFLEQLIPLDGRDYGLLTPVDTPVCLVRIAASDEEEDELIEELDGTEEILSVADAVLQEHDLTLVRSAVTLTVSGELEEPARLEEEADEGEALDDDEEDGELFESLLDRPFYVGEEQYDLFIPLDPFFVVARLEGGEAVLVEGEEFERVQPRIEAELEAQESDD